MPDSAIWFYYLTRERCGFKELRSILGYCPVLQIITKCYTGPRNWWALVNTAMSLLVL